MGYESGSEGQLAQDSLGCCSFEGEEWLLGSDVYAGMQEEAIAEVVHAPCCDSESAEEDDV